jgi:hypothetical protein
VERFLTRKLLTGKLSTGKFSTDKIVWSCGYGSFEHIASTILLSMTHPGGE